MKVVHTKKTKKDQVVNILYHGDFNCTTGFGNVSKQLIDNWSKNKNFNISILAINDRSEKPYNYKPNVLVMGETKSSDEARYIHGEFGKGQWTFYGGHDPEDYQHMVGDPPTDLNLHPNSPGYRLILNNVLFPAAKKKKQKT